MFQNTDKKLQKLFVFVTAIFAAFLLFNENIFATTRTIGNYTVSTDGWRSATGLGENKVFVDTDKITLENQDMVIDYMDSIFAIVNEKQYSYTQMTDNTYENERASAYTFGYSENLGEKKTLIVKRNGNYYPGRYSLGNAKVTLRWPEAAENQDHTVKYDVTMTIDNVVADVSEQSIQWGNIAYGNSGFELFQESSHKHFNQLQSYSVSQLKDEGTYYSFDGSRYWSTGVSYDVTIRLYEHSTGTLINANNSAMAMSFKDIDVRDKTKSAYGTNNSYWALEGDPDNPNSRLKPSTTNQASLTRNPDYGPGSQNKYMADYDVSSPTPKASRYTESISILGGLKDNKVYSWYTNSDNDSILANYLYFTPDPYDTGGLLISGTRQTGGASDESPDRASSFVALVDAREFKYRWAGSDCGTVIGFIGTSKVETDVYGSYASHAAITPGDDKILWRASYEVEIEVDDGYAVDGLKINNVAESDPVAALTFVERRNGKRVYKYTFTDIVEDQKIEVSVAPLQYSIQKLDETGSPIAGARLQLTGVANNTAVNFSTDPNIAANITNLSQDNTKIIWDSTSTAVVLQALPHGDYTITELAPPPNYRQAFDITFTVSGTGAADDAVSTTSPSGAKVDGHTVAMVNYPESFDTGLIIEKECRGSGANPEDEFDVYLTVSSSSPSLPVPTEAVYDKNGETLQVSFMNGVATFTMKHNDTITVFLRPGYTYSVDEKDYSADGYTTTYSGSRIGVVPTSDQQKPRVTIYNAKDAPTITGVDTDIGAIPFIASGALIATAGIYLVGRARRLKT